MKIGDRLKEKRGDLSLRELARRTGISNSRLCQLEQNTHNPTLETLRKLADYYETSVVGLLAGTEFSRPESSPDFTFEVPLDDGSGRVAKCWQATSQEYSNCEFSAGLVFDLPPEDVYVCLRRDGVADPSYWFLRRDEAEALIWIMTGALWALSMNPNADVKELFGGKEKEGKT